MREGWEIFRSAWGLIIVLDMGRIDGNFSFTVHTRLDMYVS